MSLWGDEPVGRSAYSSPSYSSSTARAPAPAAPPQRQQFAPPPAPGFMSALGSMGSSAPAASAYTGTNTAVKIPEPTIPVVKDLELLFKDKETGNFYGISYEGQPGPVSLLGDKHFSLRWNNYAGAYSLNHAPLSSGFFTLTPAPGGVLVGGKRRKTRKSTRRNRRR